MKSSSMSDRLGGIICLACGAELPESLRWTASLRCHGCRELEAPLRADLARLEKNSRRTLLATLADRPEATTTAA
jgi:hypothetical protein